MKGKSLGALLAVQRMQRMGSLNPVAEQLGTGAPDTSVRCGAGFAHKPVAGGGVATAAEGESRSNRVPPAAGPLAQESEGETMTDNVAQFPKTPDKVPEFLIGPFEEYRVVVDGRAIPHLTGHRESDGRIWLTVDHRLTSYFSTEEDAYQAAILAANAMAIGAGYPFSGAESKERPFAPRVNRIDTELKD